MKNSFWIVIIAIIVIVLALLALFPHAVPQTISTTGYDMTATTTDMGTTTPMASTTIPVALNSTTTAHINESAIGSGITIIPRAVVQDSRCHVGVYCIQAGTVQVEADVSGNDIESTSTTFTLSKPMIINGNTITLSQVAPAPTGNIPAQNYIFTFTIKAFDSKL